MTIRRNWLIPLVVLGVVLIGFLVWWLFLRTPPGPPLLTAAVSRTDIEQTVVATGSLDPIEIVSVGAQASGRVERLHVALGDTVAAGALIAEIDSQPQSNALANARAQLANAEAQLAGQEASDARLRAAFLRQQTMIAGEATSRADFEAAEAELKASRATIAALRAQIAQAKISVSTATVNLGYTRIRAPISGEVLSIVTKQGQTVNANQTTPTIVILGNLAQMTVKAEVSEADVIHVRPGQPVWFTILGDPDRRYEARLRQIEPAPESIVSEVSSASNAASAGSSSATRTAIYYNALFDVPNPEGRLRPMMTAQVSIVLARRPRVLGIPATALGTRGADGRYVVRVLDADGKPEERRVRIGLNTNVIAEVQDGLREGEMVVIGEGSTNPAPTQMRRMRPPV